MAGGVVAAGASLIIEGDLHSRGTSELPVRVSGLNTDTRWGGVFVLGSPSRRGQVRIAHTIVRGGTGGAHPRTRFTAALAVHGGDVRITDSQLIDGQADDGINLKYCRVDLRRNVVSGARDDAIDCDFCTGTVTANRVYDAGGDGIDFSGSDVDVVGNTIERCADKGLSIGERTRARLRDNRIRDGRTGIAVKDRSDGDIDDTVLERLEVGVALYVKKPTFGPSRARIGRLSTRQVGSEISRDASCVVERR